MQKQRGFTIIELLIATTVFSLVLLITMAGILEITRMYYRGVTQSRTQEVARQIIDEISESIRYSTAEVSQLTQPGDESYGRLFMGSKLYSYTIGRQLSPAPTDNATQSRHVLWYQEGADVSVGVDLNNDDPCHAIANKDLCQSPRELLAEKMRLGSFEVVRENENGNEAYRVSLSVVYGDDDLLTVDSNQNNPFPYSCRSANRGSEYCAVSNLSVIVNRRLQ